ncbi:glutathione S-transferase D5-like [Tubulanus polymorphus]|uniref:glutathione S-transferase D5-like n=1 Tax=Tubulanus polymorphus TaxID=672921 RepID=UPI003DA4F5FB
MKDPIFVYFEPAGPPSRAVLLTIKELKLQIKLLPVDLFSEEQFHPEFLKVNPDHTLPTIDDNGYHLWESRAVNMYLADRYSINDTLYPADPQKRGLVNRLLFYDMEQIFGKIIPYLKSFFSEGSEPSDEAKKALEESFNSFDKYLEGKAYTTGAHMTIADLHIAASISSLEPLDYDLSHWGNIVAYMKRMKSLPYWNECNEPGLNMVKEKFKQAKENKDETESED